jgi:hypothetical protein
MWSDCDRCYTPRAIAIDYVEKSEVAAGRQVPQPEATWSALWQISSLTYSKILVDTSPSSHPDLF